MHIITPARARILSLSLMLLRSKGLSTPPFYIKNVKTKTKIIFIYLFIKVYNPLERTHFNNTDVSHIRLSADLGRWPRQRHQQENPSRSLTSSFQMARPFALAPSHSRRAAALFHCAAGPLDSPLGLSSHYKKETGNLTWFFRLVTAWRSLTCNYLNIYHVSLPLSPLIIHIVCWALEREKTLFFGRLPVVHTLI